MNVINIAKDFSIYPAGRMKVDGPYSGEAFRETFLEPAMVKDEPITVILDGTRGYGSSFLEEAFGGLARKGYEPQKIIKNITIQSNQSSLHEEIKSYILHATD